MFLNFGRFKVYLVIFLSCFEFNDSIKVDRLMNFKQIDEGTFHEM